MFCSHISNRRYCIANMQFKEKEYIKIKKDGKLDFIKLKFVKFIITIEKNMLIS